MSQTIIRIPTHHAPPRPLPLRRSPGARARVIPTPSAAPAAAGILDAALTWSLAGLAATMVATWGANLLAWPWWPDLDTFAEMAQGWAEGEPPYSSAAAHSFPGQIYLFAVLGRVFGWGQTWPIYGVEVLTLAALGLAMAGWSRAVAGTRVPGLIGFLAFATYYMGLGYPVVAQRDWQASALASLAVLVIQAYPGRAARVGSALLFAAGLTLRPQIVLWLPGLLLALADDPGETEGAGRVLRRWFGWIGAAAAMTLVFYLPMVLGGQMGPWLQSLGELADPANYGADRGLSHRLVVLTGQFQELRYVGLFIGLTAVAGGRDRAARSARVWLVVMAFVWLYLPLSPAAHVYLVLPLRLVGSIALGATLATAWVGLSASSPRALLATLGVALALAVPARPPHCLIRPALEGLLAIARGEEPAEAPSGYQSLSDRFVNYPWADARALRTSLRGTPAGTRVANLLMGPIALNGAIGRRSLLGNESGFYMSRLAKGWLQADLVRRQVEALGRGGAEDRVAWIPAEFDGPATPPALAPLPRAVREAFAFERKVGAFEVWKRIPKVH